MPLAAEQQQGESLYGSTAPSKSTPTNATSQSLRVARPNVDNAHISRREDATPDYTFGFILAEKDNDNTAQLCGTVHASLTGYTLPPWATFPAANSVPRGASYNLNQFRFRDAL